MARTPDFKVVVGGQDISSYLTNLLERGKLMTVEVTDNSGKEADSIQIDVVRDGTIAIPPKGTLIQCEFGWLETGTRDYGMFYSDQPQTSGGTSGNHKLSISGTSADMSGTLKQQRTQSYHQKTVGEIVKEIAGRNKLFGAVSDAIASIKLPHIDQTQESDANFLTRLADDLGVSFKPKMGRLLFTERGVPKSIGGIPFPDIGFPATEILDYTWAGPERGNHKSVKATWHDQGKATRQSYIAGSGEPQRVLPRTYANEDEAKRAAEAALKDGAASGETANVTLVGNQNVFAESKISLTAPKEAPELGGSWSVQVARQRLSGDGYTTPVDLERER
jgi:hypothetical protein